MASTHHRNSVLVTGLHNLFVPDTTARLDNGCDSHFREFIDPIAKREEGVRRRDRA